MQQNEQAPKIYIAMACYDSVMIKTMISMTKLVKELTKAENEDRLFYVICPTCECVELYYDF